ncbi:MAG: Fe-S cluster assembly ATPase SufC [Flavobacteriaceae bacterium]|nr:Fe-S cluster assembly ATPase SufC [Flavobacteriaceae bacterium]
MLRIDNLHVSVEGKKILNGIDLHVNPGEVHAIMGPNGSGKSTLAWVVAGNEDYQVQEGSIHFKGEPIDDLDPDERAVQGLFLSFQYPVEIPGVTVTNFMKTSVNALRKARGLGDMPARELLQKIRKTAEKLQIDSKFLSRSLNDGFSGGEKKRNEIFQMMMLEPTLAILDETDSGLDIDALKVVAKGVNELRSSSRATVLITHYERLLEYVVPDFVHVILDGKIVKSGDITLARKLEDQGYDWIKNN